MISEVRVSRYQSLEQARISLGRFTVVTGHTGSGKSSLIRAIRLLVFNAKGTSFIRRGEKTCDVILTCPDEGWGVRIKRGRAADAYELAGQAQSGVEMATYTKLGGKVPEDITSLLRITDLNFAGQFDRPYLLDASGGEVARTLGELTNVTILLNAAREAQRRKNAVAAQQRDVQERLERTRADAQRFRGMPARKAAVQAAEGALSAAQELQDRLDRLKVHVGQLYQATRNQQLARATLVDAGEVPDVSALEDAHKRITRLKELTGRVQSAAYLRGESEKVINSCISSAASADQQFQVVLREAGVCPTCGQEVSSAEAEAAEAVRRHEIEHGGDGATVFTGSVDSPFETEAGRKYFGNSGHP